MKTVELLAAVVIALIILLAGAAAVGVYRLAEYNQRYSVVRMPRVLLTEVYQTLKTGDLLLFVSATHSLANSVFTQTFFSHAGLVVREGDNVHISEAQPGLELMPIAAAQTGPATAQAGPATAQAGPAAEVRMNHGADLTPLLTRLKYYTGLCCLLSLSHALDARRETALALQAERLAAKKHPYPKLWQTGLALLGYRPRAQHCFQHVAALLDAADLAPLDMRGRALRAAGCVGVCQEICEIAGRELPDSNFYLPPACIAYDVPPGAVTRL
jgi:hypothetical protein